MKKEIDRYENGIIKSFCFEDNGFGVFKFYNQEGVLIKEYSLRNGQYDGQYREFFDDGKTRKMCVYKNGKLNGIYEELDSKGFVVVKKFYRDDEEIKGVKELVIHDLKSFVVRAKQQKNVLQKLCWIVLKIVVVNKRARVCK